MSNLELTVTTGGTTLRFPLRGPVEIGRQQNDKEPLLRLIESTTEGRRRLAVAEMGDEAISRTHLLVEPGATGQLRVANLTKEHVIRLAPAGIELKSKQPAETVPVPQVVVLGGQQGITITIGQPREDPLDTTGVRVRAPGEGSPVPPPRGVELAEMPVEQLLGLIEENVAVFQTCKSAKELFEKAADVARQVVSLDSVQVILWDAAEPLAQAGARCRSVINRGLALDQVRQGKTAFSEKLKDGLSTLDISVVAAAPLMSRDREVIGALYGEREGSQSAPEVVTKLEALLLQQLAREVSLALDRLREIDVLAMTRYMSEQQARVVLRDRVWIDGCETSVTVMFCDIVGFTNISESQPKEKVFAWSGAVLRHLTACVLEHGGTLIDYTGDGLCALWGAPEAQDDQARRACRAAVAMVEGLEPLNAAGLIRRPTELRIGLNTGLVRAGNIGSERFKKFGAHGMAINLGRRIESAGRYFRCPILLGQQTLDRLQDRNQAGEFAIRRLARIMVAGAQDPLNVYQLAVDPRGDVAAWQQTYENALQQFEHGTIDDVKQAGYDLSAWRKDNDWDQPSLVLLGRIINAALDGKLNDQAKVVRFTKEG